MTKRARPSGFCAGCGFGATLTVRVEIVNGFGLEEIGHESDSRELWEMKRGIVRAKRIRGSKVMSGGFYAALGALQLART